MNMQDLELKLLAKKPIEIDGMGYIHTPLVGEVIDLGESNYNQFLSAILFNKGYFEQDFPEEITNYDLMINYALRNEDFNSVLFNAIEFIFKKNAKLYADNEDIYIVLGNGEARIERDDFSLLQKVIRTMNHITESREEDDFNPADELAAAKMKEIQDFRKSFTFQKKETINLHSMINGMAWKSNSINIENIFNLSVYQLREGFFALNNIDDYQSTLQGIFSGTVDMKKIKFDRLQWANIIHK